MVSKDPTERSRIAQIAALSRWSRESDRRKATEAARLAALGRWEREVDPDLTLDPATRLKMAEAAKKAHMLRMARKSAESRRRKGGDQS